MKNQCIVPNHQVLDNEISALYQNDIKATNRNLKLVPPNNHRRNIAKTSIHTCKYHFIGVLSGAAESFLEHLWCQVIPQAERQFLLLRQSKSNPKNSAYAHMYGPYNYDTTHFFPVGMENLVHDKPKR